MNRMVIVSNRLPITIERRDGECRALPSSGGLVTALRPVVGSRRSVWIGWPGSGESREELQRAVNSASTPQLTLTPVY
ncbi:MAG: trehalose-6-phosphate synthase, partial [Terriglobales bacterium]